MLWTRPGGEADRQVLTDLLTGLSEESSYRRFQHCLGARVPRTVLDALLPEGPDAGAQLAFVDGRLVGHALWVRVGDRRAELAVVVADAHQRGGVGGRLVAALVADLPRHGVEEVEVVAAAGNRAVEHMVARPGLAAAATRDGHLVTWRFAVSAALSGTTATRPGRAHPVGRTA